MRNEDILRILGQNLRANIQISPIQRGQENIKQIDISFWGNISKVPRHRGSYIKKIKGIQTNLTEPSLSRWKMETKFLKLAVREKFLKMTDKEVPSL